MSIILFLPILYITLSNQKERQSKFRDSLKEENKLWTTLQIIKDKRFLLYLPLTSSFSFIGTGLLFHQIFIFSQKGWTLEMLGTGYIFLGAFSVIGLLFGGPLIDMLNPKRAIKYLLLPIFIGIIILLLFENFYFLIIYMSLYGLNLGISAPFTGSLWAELFGLESLGTVKALFHAILVLASALSPVIFGYIIDWGFGLGVISTICLIMIISSSILPIIVDINE